MLSSTFVYKHVSCLCFSVCQDIGLCNLVSSFGSLSRVVDQPIFIFRSQIIVVEADSSIQLIMEKLQSYKSKVSLYFDGFQYQLGVFPLRVGKVVPVHSESVKEALL
ncbi:unnamed protein product [Brassica oleracea]